MGYDPEPPTRRIPPQQPQGPPPGGQIRETEYATADPGFALQELTDRVRSLQTALALVGVLAAAALGVALWTLLSEDDGGDASGASSEQVAELEDRVERVEERVGDRATEGQLSEVQEDVEQLSQQVEEAAAEGGGDDAQQAVEDLSEDVQALSDRVDDLAAQGGSPPEGTTTTP